jgi:hypothetical protein
VDGIAQDGATESAAIEGGGSDDGAGDAGAETEAGPVAEAAPSDAAADALVEAAADSSGDALADARDGTTGDAATVAFSVGQLGPDNGSVATSTAVDTAVGDLLLLVVYMEPGGQGSATAAYPTLSTPAGFTAAPWSPIASNDANLTTEQTNRAYVWWGHATAAGAQPVSVAVTSGTFHFVDTAVVTVKGVTASGVPFADTPSVATYPMGADVSSYPSVTVTPAAANTAFLWIGTSWTQSRYGTASGFTGLLYASTLSVSYLLQGPPSPVTVSASVSPTNLLTSTLVSFR